MSHERNGKLIPFKKTIEPDINFKEIITAITMGEFIELVKREDMLSASVISRINTQRGKTTRNIVYSNVFSASNEENTIEFSGECVTLSDLEAADNGQRMSAMISTFVNAQEGLKLIKQKVGLRIINRKLGFIATSHINAETGEPFTKEKLQEIKDLKKKFATPRPITIWEESADL